MSVDSQNSEKIRSTGMSDENLVDEHVRLSKVKHEPTKGFLQAPLIFVFVFGCLIFICSIQLAHTTNDFQLHPPIEVVDLSPEEIEAQRIDKKLKSGENVFKARCASCHQANGLGITGQYPPLAGSKWATTDSGLITNIILKGLKGEIIVKGEKYGTSAAINMAAVPIDDREIANVVTYVRQSWGNESSEVFEEDVATYRSSSADQLEQWTGEQLMSLYPESFTD